MSVVALWDSEFLAKFEGCRIKRTVALEALLEQLIQEVGHF